MHTSLITPAEYSKCTMTGPGYRQILELIEVAVLYSTEFCSMTERVLGSSSLVLHFRYIQIRQQHRRTVIISSSEGHTLISVIQSLGNFLEMQVHSSFTSTPSTQPLSNIRPWSLQVSAFWYTVLINGRSTGGGGCPAPKFRRTSLWFSWSDHCNGSTLSLCPQKFSSRYDH